RVAARAADARPGRALGVRRARDSAGAVHARVALTALGGVRARHRRRGRNAGAGAADAVTGLARRAVAIDAALRTAVRSRAHEQRRAVAVELAGVAAAGDAARAREQQHAYGHHEEPRAHAAMVRRARDAMRRGTCDDARMRASSSLAMCVVLLAACGDSSSGGDGGDLGPGHDGGPGTDFGPGHDGGPPTD